MDGATIAGCSSPRATGVGESSGTSAFLPCCIEAANAAVTQTKAIKTKAVRDGRLLLDRINVLPVSSVQARRASGLRLKRHCTRDGAYKARQKTVGRPPRPRWTCRESGEAANVAPHLHNCHILEMQSANKLLPP